MAAASRTKRSGCSMCEWMTACGSLRRIAPAVVELLPVTGAVGRSSTHRNPRRQPGHQRVPGEPLVPPQVRQQPVQHDYAPEYGY